MPKDELARLHTDCTCGDQDIWLSIITTKVFVLMSNIDVSIGSWKVQRLSGQRWADEHGFGLRDVRP